MFFQTKRNRRKTTRQTLSTEQLEPKAMFSVSPVEPLVALDVGPVNQASVERCAVIEPVFNVGEDGRSIVHPQYNVGEDGRMVIEPVFNVGEDGRSIVHPQYNVGEDGRSIVHPQYNVGEDGRMVIEPVFNVGGSANPEWSTDLRSENRFVFEVPKNDSGITLHASANPHAGPEGFIKLGDIKGEFQLTQRIGGSASPGGDDVFMPKPNRGVSLHDSVHCLVGDILTISEEDDADFMPKPNRLSGSAGPGGSTFMTGEDGRSIVQPPFNIGNDGRMIIHPQFNVGDDGRMIIHPQFSVGKAPFTTGAGGDSIVHPEFMTGVNSLAQANQQPQIASVWTNGNATSMAPRHAALARMGR